MGTYLKWKSLKVLRMRAVQVLVVVATGMMVIQGEVMVLVVMIIIFESMRSLEHMSSAAKTSSRLGVCQSTDCLSVSEHCSPVPPHLTGTVIGVTSVVHLS